MNGERHNIALDRLAYQAADRARSLGLENGIDVFLQLLHLRWMAERSPEHRLSWSKLQSALPNDYRPGQFLDESPIGFNSRLSRHDNVPTRDGVRVLRYAVEWVERLLQETQSTWSLRQKLHEGFESLLRLRSRLLDRTGEWETPRNLARLMVMCADQLDSVLDPACGLGSVLIEASKMGVQNCTGYEINQSAAARARMRFELANVSVRVHVADGLSGHVSDDKTDAVIVQPPWGLKYSLDETRLSAPHGFGPPTKSGDFAWMQRAYAAISRSGRAIALMPAGTLFRGGLDAQVRATMLREGIVEAIIALPPGLVPNASVAGCIWILRGRGELRNRDEVLLMDTAPLVHEAENGLELGLAAIDALTITLRNWRQQSDHSSLPVHVCRSVLARELIDLGNIDPSQHLATPPAASNVRPKPPTQLLSELRVANFKSVGAPQSIPLAPITLIYGPNSAGKSSLLQSLLLMKQSVSAESLVTQGEFTDAGSFIGAVHKHDPHRRLGIGVTFGTLDRWEISAGVPDPSLMRSIDLTFSADESGLPRQEDVAIRFGRWALPFGCNITPGVTRSRSFLLDMNLVAEVFEGIAEGALLYPFDRRRKVAETPSTASFRNRSSTKALRLLRRAEVDVIECASAGLLPTSEAYLQPVSSAYRDPSGRDTSIANFYVSRTLQLAAGASEELRLLLSELTYLGPLRSRPQRFYNRAAAATGAGTAGEHTALHLFDNASELAQVNEWLKKLEVPYTLQVVPVGEGDSSSVVGDLVAMILTDRRSSIDVSPADVGFGVSQVLPIVVQLLAKQETVICVEQPEIHLHPGLQAKLGDLFIESSLLEGRANQLLVETHSEHLILRLQRRIRDGSLEPDRLAVLYVDQDDDGEVSVKHLRLDENGDFLDEWPNGFFEERLEELFGALE